MSTPSTAEPTPFDDGELYDALFEGIRHGIDFYVDLARQAQGPILDIACGTGRILLPCLQAGADGDGLDLSAAMLATLRKKAAALNLTPELYQADMSDFRVPRRYALIMITFNAFIHNVTQEAQVRCQQLCREHLAPGGMLAFDTFFPSLGIIGAAEGTRDLELETRHPETGQVLRLYDTRWFDRVAQIQRSVNEIEFLDNEGKVESVHRSEFCTRWVYKEELALLLRAAGFTRWNIHGDFDRRPLTKESDLMIVEAWAEPSNTMEPRIDSMDAKREFLRHVVATLAYRGGKVLREAPADFAATRVGPTTRSAVAIVAHLGDLLDWAASMVHGKPAWHPEAPKSWDDEIKRFFAGLSRLDEALAGNGPLPCPAERLFQGPLADALTHIGQLATLRRLAGSPVKSENFYEADVEIGRVGPEQTPPPYEFD